MNAIYVRQQFTYDQWELVGVAVELNLFSGCVTVSPRMDVTILWIDGADVFDVQDMADTIVLDDAYRRDYTLELLGSRGLDTEVANDLVVRSAKFIARLHAKCYTGAVLEDPS